MKTESIIQKKAYEFSLNAIGLYKVLKREREFEIGSQLLRSATSIGANVEEASAAQSKKDFISKMSIASKEARETKYWLRLLKDSKLVDYDYTKHLKDVEEIVNILSSIVKTSKERYSNN